MVGFYVGVAVDPKVDFDRLGKWTYDHGYNAVSIFLTTGFGNTLFPWKLNGGKFDYNSLNPVWKEHIYTMLERFAYYRIRTHICFVDQFHKEDDSPNPDPFRQGFKSDDEELWYSSLPLDLSFYSFLQWDELKPRKYTNYRTTSAVGHGLELMADYYIEAARQVKEKYSDATYSWKWGNETRAVTDADGKFIKSKSRGDRDEVFIWIQNKWTAAGFKDGKDVFSYFDYSCNKADLRTPDYDCLDDGFNRGIRQFRNSRLEIHGILTVKQIQDYIDNAHLDPNYVLWSTDGDLRMQAEYKVLGHAKYNTDLKFDIKKGEAWSSTDFMKNFERYEYRYRDYIQ